MILAIGRTAGATEFEKLVLSNYGASLKVTRNRTVRELTRTSVFFCGGVIVRGQTAYLPGISYPGAGQGMAPPIVWSRAALAHSVVSRMDTSQVGLALHPTQA